MEFEQSCPCGNTDDTPFNSTNSAKNGYEGIYFVVGYKNSTEPLAKAEVPVTPIPKPRQRTARPGSEINVDHRPAQPDSGPPPPPPPPSADDLSANKKALPGFLGELMNFHSSGKKLRKANKDSVPKTNKGRMPQVNRNNNNNEADRVSEVELLKNGLATIIPAVRGPDSDEETTDTDTWDENTEN